MNLVPIIRQTDRISLSFFVTQINFRIIKGVLRLRNFCGRDTPLLFLEAISQ